MNVYTIRLPLIIIIMLILVISVLKYGKKYSKRKRVIVIIISFVITLNFICFPYESFFLRFKTLDQSFHYSFPELKMKESIVYQNYGFVISRGPFSYLGTAILKRDKKGWLY